MGGPAWLGIGAQRSGTTWLSRQMRRHPGVWVTPIKELHYFDQRDRAHQVAGRLQLARMLAGRDRYEKSWRVNARRAFRRHTPTPDMERFSWDLRHLFGSRDDDWYASLFDLAPDGQLPGEITPSYAGLDDATVGAVHDIAPDARLIYLLRNPIDRVWSQLALNNTNAGREADRLPNDLGQFLTRPGVAGRTSYVATIERWAARFGHNRLFIGFFDDISRHPKKTLARIYTHIGAGPKVPHRVQLGRVHRKAESTIPTHVAIAIAHNFVDEIDAAAARVGGHAITWQAMAHRLIDDPPPVTQLSHPLLPEELGVDNRTELCSRRLDRLSKLVKATV